MKNAAWIFLTAGISFLLWAAPDPPENAALRALVDSEIAFARQAATEGIRTAFLHYLAEDALVFRPTPEPGREAYTESSAVPGILTWRPEFADISSAGDLGYTTGPYELKKNPGDSEPSAFGHYVSIWRIQRDGLWRVIIDAGIPHDKPAPNGSVNVTASPRLAPHQDRRMADGSSATENSSFLLGLDRSFSKSSLDAGIVAAYSSYADPRIRFYRPHLFPVLGKSAVLKLLGEHDVHALSKTTGAGISRSGDLGYTYGVSEFTTIDGTQGMTSYVRIWKRNPDGHWRLTLDIANPIPAQSPKP